MKNFTRLVLLLGIVCGCGQPQPAPVANPSATNRPAANSAATATESNASVAKQAKVRQFVFHYKFRLKDLKPTGNAEQDVVQIWVPRPSTTEHQKINPLRESAPLPLEDFQESRYRNRLRYLQLPIPANGEISIDLPYEVTRQEVITPPVAKKTAELAEAERTDLLAANQLVPTAGKPLDLLQGLQLKTESLDKARQLYDLVDQHVVYKKEGTGWGRGDTNWVCDSGYGNCTDFHSLFISLARSQGIPAQFEIGFSIPTDKKEGPISGYHCWAWFHTPERGWVAVDISEADKAPAMKDYYFGNLTADRVMFSTGRDLELNPPPKQRPTNFLIYPYIEVGGETLPKENLELQFSFQEQE